MNEMRERGGWRVERERERGKTKHNKIIFNKDKEIHDVYYAKSNNKFLNVVSFA